MKIYTPTELKAEMTRLGLKWLPFQLIGVRSKEDAIDAFDDRFFLIDGDKFYSYTGTTNPGIYWHQNFGKKTGVALLKPGQYIDCWELGKHKGLYPAWVQRSPVTVYRDDDKDNKSDEGGKEETGLFGINIHHASADHVSTKIGKWSAGCQVFNDPVQHGQLMILSEASGLKKFSYTLLKEF